MKYLWKRFAFSEPEESNFEAFLILFPCAFPRKIISRFLCRSYGTSPFSYQIIFLQTFCSYGTRNYQNSILNSLIL